MLTGALKLLNPKYALIMLVLFGAWHGYSFVRSFPEKINLRGLMLQAEESPVREDSAFEEPVDSNRFFSKINLVSGLKSIGSWLLLYTLFCIASLPAIKKVLSYESNFLSGLMVVFYVVLGVLSAVVLMGFASGFLRAVLLLCALGYSFWLIVRVSSEAENTRLENTLSSS